MSVAVAVRKGSAIVIAADTQENFGDERVPRANHGGSKILRVGRTYIAMTGSGLYDNILRDYLGRGRAPRLGSENEIFTFFLSFWRQLRRRYSLVNDQAHEDDRSPFADLDAAFLVANRAGIFYVSETMSVMQLRAYHAIGSGAPYALGALHVLAHQSLAPETVARRACEAGITFDVHSGGEIEVFRV